ncbi:Notchless protein homolog 1 [Seminavis robusta]|uniref:Notchless protein homolog 1 n=1 Tax=Seminavis robusta TaxID=568900 RepID=A0A9N8E221_9STRA|nr:Notchless protein homolog 1 [Seminavis robusta]|eukprot:Sro465_g148630.1 Notchless protein homolog 1 (583) ;mRNA; r:43703-45451
MTSSVPSSSSTTTTTTTTKRMSDAAAAAATAAATAAAKGGIAWGGSLVGSKNPHNLGYRYSTPHKRFRAAGASDDGSNDKLDLPTNVVVQFSNRQGEELADVLDLPTNSTMDDLNALLHSLLNDTDRDNNKRIPYSFYAKLPHSKEHPELLEDVEITTESLATFLLEHQVSTEQTLQITYQPMAVFRVRPITRCTDTLPGHTEAVLHVSYSPNGRHLASGGGDTTVRFWDVHTNLPKYTCRKHKDHVLCTAWSPDGTKFASVDKRGVLILWNPQTGESIGAPIQAHKQWITSLAWEPLHCNKSCDRIVTAGKDGTAKVWNVRTRKHIKTLAGHTDSIECVKWGGENLIYTASRDRTIKVWNATQDVNRLGILVRTLKGHGHRVNTLALSSDYICRTGPFDPNDKKLLLQKDNHDSDKLYELAKARYQEFQQSSCPQETLVSGSDDYTLFVWNPVTSKHPLKRLTGHQNLINHISFSPDGRFFASASFDKKVKLWNGLTGEFLVTLTGHVGAVYQVAWSADSQYIVSASADSTAKLWNAAKSKKQAIETLPGHADQVFALDWSPNGASVATGSKDRTLKIWKH